jgi:hypothetical protein
MEPAKILRLESVMDAVVIKSNTGETVAVISLNKDGSIDITPAAGKTVNIGGSSHPLPLWDTFQTALATFFDQFAGKAPIAVATSGIPSPTLVAAANAILGLLRGGNFNSTVANNG